MTDVVIEVKNLGKFYGQQRGIEDVAFDVNKGEIMGFIGPNGAGKTTTLRSLLALIHPTSGYAKIFNKDCIEYASEIAGKIGYLSGENSFYENMQVGTFLNYASELYGKKDNPRIKELSERLDLDLKRKIVDLSLGNKKRLA